MVNSRNKGKRGEREVASLFRDAGFSGARRTQQYSGTEGTSDVTVPELGRLHVEVKWRQRQAVRQWMWQALSDKRDGQTPLVVHRDNNSEWLATMPLADLFEILREAADLLWEGSGE